MVARTTKISQQSLATSERHKIYSRVAPTAINPIKSATTLVLLEYSLISCTCALIPIQTAVLLEQAAIYTVEPV